ncbi:hypothetical protein IMCC26134_15085 [Verrucomicrobia bacterium IMCC26134]|nr:hypothetical protein IMCC26134_15085 [Verrucomicrobia bacterium IMCC26134]
MANTLTNLIPDAYVALNVVSRELTGLIAATNRLTGIERLAVGQSLRSSAAPVNTAGKDTTAAMALPAAADQTIGNVAFTLTKSRAFPFSWSGEDTVGINSGPGYLTVQQQQIAQAFRAAVAEISTDGYAAARVAASRAYGTAGTTAFATNLGESAQVKKILDDNGAPMSDRSLVIDTTAGAALRTLLNNPLTANASLSGDSTRAGVLIDVNGFAIREESKIAAVTKGTGTSYTSSAAGFAVGTTSIPVITGSGTILAGDVITFSGDTNKYVVKTGVAAAGTIVIAEPGLQKALPASATALTIGNSFTANLAFSRDAIVLGTRLPALPATGDMAIMRETIIDEKTGLAFELAAYGGYRMVTFEVSIAWGWAVEKPAHVAVLLG